MDAAQAQAKTFHSVFLWLGSDFGGFGNPLPQIRKVSSRCLKLQGSDVSSTLGLIPPRNAADARWHQSMLIRFLRSGRNSQAWKAALACGRRKGVDDVKCAW